MDREQKTILTCLGCTVAGGGFLLFACLLGTVGVMLVRANAAALLSLIPVNPGLQRVSLDDAYTAYQDGSAVFVDARSLEQYQQGHIPGALSLPADEIAGRLDELDPDDPIITYCA
jgi:hypothetical protein